MLTMLQNESMKSFSVENDYGQTIQIPKSIIDLIGHDFSCKRIAKGSSSTVYRISADNGTYALKTIASCVGSKKHTAALEEINVLELLDNIPSVVRLRTCSEIVKHNNSVIYILEDYCDSLAEYMKGNKLSLVERIFIGIGICCAIDDVLGNGILHLDIQPKNILYDRKRSAVFLGDFNSALKIEDSDRNDDLRGTLAYMAPEGYRTHKYSEKTEIYSCGMVLYWLLNNGSLPFLEDGEKELVIYKRLAGTAIPTITSQPVMSIPIFDNNTSNLTMNNIDRIEIEAATNSKYLLKKIFEKSLAFEPQERYNSIRELANDLQRTVKELLMVGKHIGIENIEAASIPEAIFEDISARTFMCQGDNAEHININLIDYNSTKNVASEASGILTGRIEDDKWNHGHSEEWFDADSFASSVALFEPHCSISFNSHNSLDNTVQPKEIEGANVAEDIQQQKPQLNIKKVQFSAIAPKSISKGEYAIIDIAMFEDAYREIVDTIMAQAEDPVKEKLGVSNIRTNSIVKIRLSSPDIVVEDNDIEQQWVGGYLLYSFAVLVPEDYSKNKILFNATVYENDIMRTKIIFDAKCSTSANQNITVFRKDITSAFMSYASEDRVRVATIIQGIKLLCPDIDLFFDIESLRSGEDWEQVLYREIEKRDILFLCWSNHAKKSEWVEREWRYALNSKGIDYIEPVPIERPDKCPPPEELNAKHFSDNLLYVIDAYT